MNLVDTLNGSEFTVFAPTDDAFAKIDPATIEKLKTDSNLLTSILTYHVVPGQASPAQVTGTHKTVQGGDVTVTGDGQQPQGQRRRRGVRRSPYRQRHRVPDRHGADAAGQLGRQPPRADAKAPDTPQFRGLLRLVRDPSEMLRLRITDMFTLVLIGFLGGLITGISPCILPVLPVIFFSGAQSARYRSARRDRLRRRGDGGQTQTLALIETLRPYRVIGGLVLSFSLVTLVGTALLSLLHLPQDAIRWAGLVALTAIGLGLIFPRFEEILEKPFSRIPQLQMGQGKSGFGLGLALGVLYVPCAGPVLAAIVVAGATGSIGLSTVALTVSFAIGAALPLLFFALAGQRVAERVGTFRRHQRRIRMIGGIVMLVFAVALVFNVPAKLQRAIPDYTSGLQDKVVASDEIQEKLNLGGLVNDQNRELSNCTNGAGELESCGTAPDIKGIDGWLNTPGGAPST